jgi:phosphonate transport system ATP-binding protein
MLEINNLSKKFSNQIQALKGVSLKVKKGEFISILGPSGSGKTTLLRSLNGLETIDSGEVIFDNDIITKESLPEIRKKTGMIFQEFNLVNNISSINNVLTGLLNSSSKFLSMFYLFTKEQKLQALQVLDIVGLLDKSNNRADELSGGQRQRVGIARAIIKKPLLLLADEPVASLDPKAALSTMKLLKKVNKAFNITVICNLHQTNLAMEFSDRVIGLSNGSVVFDQEAKYLDKNIEKLYS